jgi:hypothetical protein
MEVIIYLRLDVKKVVSGRFSCMELGHLTSYSNEGRERTAPLSHSLYQSAILRIRELRSSVGYML